MMKPKTCKICKDKFDPQRNLQMVCSFKCSIEYYKKQKDKEWAKRKQVMKKELLTKSDYIKILQQLVNRYVRQRDGNFCISCNKKVSGKIDAGHMFSVGNYPSVRFDLRNISSQCIKCNQYNGGSLLEYRKHLIEKIGLQEFEDLERLAHQNRQFTIDEIKEMIETYKQKTK